jgi:alkylation response protein AidB-like acyl-CoA dehydrogenase
MNFDLSEDQIALRDGIRNLVAGRFETRRVRAGFDRAMFEELATAGVFTLRNDGFGWADAAIVFEELGRAFVPGPLVWSFLAADADLPAPGGEPARIVGGVDAGATLVVEHPEVVDGVIVLDDDRVGYVARSDLEPTARPRPLDPLTPVARVAELPRGIDIGDASAATAWRARGAALTAAFMVGLAQHATELAVAHANQRRQFGRVIGSFQAVKHICADMAVRTELARVAVHAAAVHLDEPGTGDRAGARRAIGGAKVLAGEAAVSNGRAAMQVHAAMGFTWAVDVHLLLKRAWVLDTQFGTVDRHAWSIPAPEDHDVVTALSEQP